jgi:aminoglycoside phosphotransferase family enzyme
MSTSNEIYAPSQPLTQETVLSYIDSLLSRLADHIRTHCAHIFLIGDIAYKLKTSVTYSYLDITTLDMRKRLCERKYELNSPVLPDIYLSVAPIIGDNNQQISISGSGTVVEWAL